MTPRDYPGQCVFRAKVDANIDSLEVNAWFRTSMHCACRLAEQGKHPLEFMLWE
jgi:hypothetical protein